MLSARQPFDRLHLNVNDEINGHRFFSWGLLNASNSNTLQKLIPSHIKTESDECCLFDWLTK